MSAYDDFCGCGDYACPECFGASLPDSLDNAWYDRELVTSRPNSPAGRAAYARLEAHGMMRTDAAARPKQEKA